MTKPLSPAARTVLDAFLGDAENTGLQMDDMRENVAAALRAAADQVVPTTVDPRLSTVRSDLMHIAAELESQQ